MMHELLAAFIPLFVSIDAFGLVPMFLSLTDGMTERARRSVTFEAVSFALAICLGFMLLGNANFQRPPHHASRLSNCGRHTALGAGDH